MQVSAGGNNELINGEARSGSGLLSTVHPRNKRITLDGKFIYIYIKRKGILRFLEARKIDFSRVRLTWRVILVNYNIGEGRSVLFLCGGWSSSRGTTVNSI